MARNLSLAARSLRRAPAFSFAAIITVALAVGAVTAISAVVESVLLRPISTRAIGELVSLETNIPDMALDHMALAPAEVFELDTHRELFQSVGGYRVAPMNLTGSGEAQRVAAVSTIGSFFNVFGVHPYLGRLFDSTDARGNKNVVVLNYEFWRALTGGDHSILGRTLQLDGESYTVIGVLSQGFDFPRATQLWTPHPPINGFDQRDNRCCKAAAVVARLRPGLSRVRVSASLAAIMAGWREKFPQVYATQNGAGAHQQTLTSVPLAEALAGQLAAIVRVLVVAVGLLLLIAYANVASLQLVRATTRGRETALRLALGASPSAIARQVGVESFAIAVVGGALGLALGAGATTIIQHVGGWQSTVQQSIDIDWRVVLFAVLVSLAAALTFGLAPALLAARVDPNTLLSSASRSATAGPRGNRLLGGAVIVQIAFALVLLLACGVSVRSLQRLLAVDPGFRPEGVMRMRLSLNSSRFAGNPERIAFQDALLARLEALPGSIAAATVSGGPFGYLKQSDHSMVAKAIGTGTEVHVSLWIIGGDYFRAMGIPLHEGRAFNAGDDAGAPKVWIVDDVLAKRLYHGESAVGKQIEWQAPVPDIIGVVGAIKKTDLAQPDEPSLYWSFAQYPQPELSVVLRTTLDANAALPMMRSVVHDLDPTLPAFDLAPMEQGIDDSLAPRRIGLDVLVAFALLSLTLSMLGIYGVLSYTTALRAREIGIRIALGADGRRVMIGVLRRGVTLAAVGIAIGAAMFLAAGRVFGAFVFSVSPHDTVVILVGVSAVAITAFAACWLPARRAARVDPAIAFRTE